MFSPPELPLNIICSHAHFWTCCASFLSIFSVTTLNKFFSKSLSHYLIDFVQKSRYVTPRDYTETKHKRTFFITRHEVHGSKSRRREGNAVRKCSRNRWSPLGMASQRTMHHYCHWKCTSETRRRHQMHVVRDRAVYCIRASRDAGTVALPVENFGNRFSGSARGPWKPRFHGNSVPGVVIISWSIAKRRRTSEETVHR